MNVITNFFERKEQKRLLFERNALMELTLTEVIKDARKRFLPYYDRSLYIQRELEETSIDVAIEAYLEGVSYSRFSHYGETEQMVRERAERVIQQFTNTLYDYWLFWGEYDVVLEELYFTCESFIELWWRIGYQKGVKRRRLRLH
ncbi:DUF2521 family protein [Pueribacillus sp. YX66]|uniref:DUF2521 family protein n=1 Tax=Pueribacillus sp. YX66 TaxID=3229242 RepID=UPI00358D91C2